MSREVGTVAPPRLAQLKEIGAGLCIMAFPLMLLFGFVSHPNILSFRMVTDYAEWAAEWRGSFLFHFGHLLVMLAVPLIIVACIRLMAMLDGLRAWYGFFGGILGVFGAFMLAVDKGALTFVLTAFRALPEAEFQASTPAIQAIFERGGWLWITWGFVALPIGFIVLAVGLIRQGAVPTWQGICMIVGLLLLLNPDIEIISSVGALLMCGGFIPLGARINSQQFFESGLAALLSAITIGCAVVEAVAQTTAGNEPAQFILSLERLSNQSSMPFAFFDHVVDERHPQWGRYQSSLARFPSMQDCLLPTARTSEGRDLSAFDWAGFEDHRDIEVCVFRLAASLETPERMRTWLLDQGYQISDPAIITPNVTGKGPNDSDVGFSGILPAEEFEARIRFRRSLNPLGYLWAWLFPSPPHHRDHALTFVYSGQGRIVGVQSSRRGG